MPDVDTNFGGVAYRPATVNPAADYYNQLLSVTFRAWRRIYDPSYALSQDPQTWDKIQRDAKFGYIIQTRRQLCTGSRIVIVPASETPEDKQAASIVEQALSKIENFWQARFNLTDADFRGSAYAFIKGRRQPWRPTIGEARKGNLRRAPTFDWWLPQALVDVDRNRFQLIRDDYSGKHLWHLWSVARSVYEPLEHPEWFVRHVYENAEYTYGYGRGLLDALHFCWYAKITALEEGLNGLERWAQGIVSAAIEGLREASTGKPNTAVAAAWLAELEKWRSRHIFVHDKNDTLTTADGPTQGHEIVKFFLEYCDQAAMQVCLGGVLPFGGGEDVGSNARSETEADASGDYLQGSRELLGESLTRGPVRLFWDLNRDNFALLGLADAEMPKLQVRNDKKADPEKGARIVASALTSGMKVREDEAYELHGLSVPNDGDRVIEPRQNTLSGLDALFTTPQETVK